MNSLWTQWLSFTLLLKILISNLDQQVQEEGSIPRGIQVFHKHLVPGSVPAPQDRHRGPPSPLPATIYPKVTLNGAGGTCAPRHKAREGSRVQKHIYYSYRICTTHTQIQRDKHFQAINVLPGTSSPGSQAKAWGSSKPEISLHFSLHHLSKKIVIIIINNNIQAFPIPKMNLLIILNI